jgi:alpha-beta hydrolase superfamily lysophospholipase
MKKVLSKITAIVSILLLLCVVAAWIILPRLVLQPVRYSREQLRSVFPHGLEPSVYGMDYEEYDVMAADSITLDGLLIHAVGQPRGTIIMIHGIGAYKEVFFHLAKKLSEEGYHIVLTDLRAMGQSGGEHCTYGWLEKNDISLIAENIKSRFPDLPVVVYGTSLGGAIALQAMANNDRIDAGIIECTYDEIQKVVRGYTARALGFQFDLLADFALWRASCEASFDASKMNPCDFARAVNQPVLIAHGDHDLHIPISWGKHNFDNLASEDKIFYEIIGASHHDLGTVGGEAYSNTVLQFLKTRLNTTKIE